MEYLRELIPTIECRPEEPIFSEEREQIQPGLWSPKPSKSDEEYEWEILRKYKIGQYSPHSGATLREVRILYPSHYKRWETLYERENDKALQEYNIENAKILLGNDIVPPAAIVVGFLLFRKIFRK